MTISKKDFINIAKIINDNVVVTDDKRILTNAFCNYFKSENKKFNSFKFYNACMINELGSSNKKVVINTVELLKQVSKENKVLQSKVNTYEADIVEANRKKLRSKLRSSNDLDKSKSIW
jgi:hypothetical protein